MVSVYREGFCQVLGFIIGPGSKPHWWREPCRQYVDRCHRVHAAGWGALDTCMQYNARALTTLQYTAQIRPRTPEMQDMEFKMVDRLTRGPYRWLPQDAAFSLWASSFISPRTTIRQHAQPHLRRCESRWTYILHGAPPPPTSGTLTSTPTPTPFSIS